MSRWKQQISSSMFLSYSFDKNHHYVLYSLSSVRSFLCVYVAETNLAALLYKNLCTQNKTKGLSTKRKPYYQNESRAIVLLCTYRRKWVHFLYAVFQMFFIPVMAAKELCWNNSYSRVHLPFCIRILQEHKEKD